MDLSQVPFEPYYRDEHCVIYNADCRKVLPFLPKFDLGLHDPPYGIGAGQMSFGKWQTSRMEKTNWDEATPSQFVLEAIIQQADNTIIWGGNYFQLPPTRAYIVWDKGAGFRNRDFAECEQAWCSWDGNAKVYSRDPLAMRDYEGKVHPTQKPVALYRWCLANFCKSDTVLDCYAGSLTTAVACKLENKFCVCIEASEAYCEKGVKRLEQGVLF